MKDTIEVLLVQIGAFGITLIEVETGAKIFSLVCAGIYSLFKAYEIWYKKQHKK